MHIVLFNCSYKPGSLTLYLDIDALLYFGPLVYYCDLRMQEWNGIVNKIFILNQAFLVWRLQQFINISPWMRGAVYKQSQSTWIMDQLVI